MIRKCKYLSSVNAFLDGELPEGKAILLKEHLSNCSICQEEIRVLSGINDLILNFEDEPAPEHLIEKINSAVSSGISVIKDTRNFAGPLKWALAAGIAVSFLIGAYLSNLVFSSTGQYSLDLGEDTLYSYFEGVE